MSKAENKSEEEDIWGMLVNCEGYGRHGDTKHDYKTITYTESKTDYKDHMHASHAMIFAKNKDVLWGLYPTKAAILMQMRFDGLLGFPGGLVDPGEEPVHGLNRELHEEIGLDLVRLGFKDDHHLVTFLQEKKKLVLHFYVQEITLEQFKEIESHCTKAHEYGVESLGCLRPPLYTMGDNFRGFPAFLCNQFAGNAKEELFIGLHHTKLFTREEIEKAMELSENFKPGLQTKSGTNVTNENDDRDENWGILQKYASYGRHGDTKHDFKIITKETATTEYADFEHVAHGMFVTKQETNVWKDRSPKASVLIQMRFDGRIGFPGGHVEHGEDIVTGLNRELYEELGLDVTMESKDTDNNYRFLEDDYFVTYIHKEKKFVLHFYIKEVSVHIFQKIMGNSSNAHEYGKEAAGYLRPPLYTKRGTMEGFPNFLLHQFAGNAKEELFVGLIRTGIYSREEIDKITNFVDTFKGS